MPNYAAMTKDELIAELQQASSSLSKLQSQYSELESIGRSGSFESDPTTLQESWSDGMYRLWGYDHGEIAPGIDAIIGHSHEDDRDFVARQFASLNKDSDSVAFDFRRLLKNGGHARCQCHAKVEHGASGGVFRISGVILDTSEFISLDEKFQRKRKMFDLVQKLSRSGGWVLDVETRELYWSDYLGRMFGYEPEDLPQDKYAFFLEQMLHPDDLELVMQTIDLIFQEKSQQYLDYRGICKNGDIKYFHNVITPEMDTDDKVHWLIGAIMDVTSRKQALTSFRRSEEQFRIVFEKAPIGIVLFNEKGVVLECNPHFLKIFDAQSSESYIGRNLLETAMDSQFVQSIKDTIQDGWGNYEGYYCSVVTRKTAYVQTLNLEVAPNLYLSVLSDLTERKKAEEALRESEDRYALAVKGSNDGIWDVDLRTGDFYHSPKLIEMLGYEMEEFEAVAGDWRGRVHPEDQERVYAAVEQCLSGAEDNFSEEYRVQRKDGSYFWVHAQGITAKNAKGRVYRIAGAYSDISERKNAEMELIGAKEKAEEASKVKNAFLANMSHEIRTPLNGVIGLVQLLQSSRLNKEQKSLVSMIHDTGRNLLKILNDILDLSRIEAGHLRIHPELFSLNTVVGEITGAFAIEARNKKLELISEVDTNVPSALMGDVTRIRQVLYNLVGNSLKYTEKGSVRLEAYCLPHVRSPKSVLLHFAIVDTGIGISEDKLESVFESFTQGETSYTKQYGGTGLGLAIVKNLVQRMGGTLAISSEFGVGTEIHVTLELERAEDTLKSEDVPKKISNWEQKECAILLVEDDPVNRIMATRLLEKMGCSVRIATNGQEALDLLGEVAVDCVLMDIQMPVMDGLEATRRIRGDGSGAFDPNIPIVAITAYAMEGDKQKFLDAGMSAYLSKPVDLLALKEVLGKIITTEPRNDD